MDIVISKILDSLKANSNLSVVNRFNFESFRENQFVVFLKPEVFFSENENFIKNSLNMIFSKFNDYWVFTNWIVLVNWVIMEKYGFMDRHYGFINTLSRKASQIITEEENDKILQVLEIDNSEEYKLYWWHEFLSIHPELTAFELDELWKTKQSIRVKSWFYVQKYDYNWEKVIFVNAFHPVQLEYFTNPNHKTLLLLCDSDRNWSELRNDLIGNTYPEKATPDSIRWDFYVNKDVYGIEKVYISANCIHMSAWPLESFFEMNNFFWNLEETGFNILQTNIYKEVLSNWWNVENVKLLLSNPKKIVDWKEINAFDLTEDKNTKEGIKLVFDILK